MKHKLVYVLIALLSVFILWHARKGNMSNYGATVTDQTYTLLKLQTDPNDQSKWLVDGTNLHTSESVKLVDGNYQVSYPKVGETGYIIRELWGLKSYLTISNDSQIRFMEVSDDKTFDNTSDYIKSISTSHAELSNITQWTVTDIAGESGIYIRTDKGDYLSGEKVIGMLQMSDTEYIKKFMLWLRSSSDTWNKFLDCRTYRKSYTSFYFYSDIGPGNTRRYIYYHDSRWRCDDTNDVRYTFAINNAVKNPNYNKTGDIIIRKSGYSGSGPPTFKPTHQLELVYTKDPNYQAFDNCAGRTGSRQILNGLVMDYEYMLSEIVRSDPDETMDTYFRRLEPFSRLIKSFNNTFGYTPIADTSLGKYFLFLLNKPVKPNPSNIIKMTAYQAVSTNSRDQRHDPYLPYYISCDAKCMTTRGRTDFMYEKSKNCSVTAGGSNRCSKLNDAVCWNKEQTNGLNETFIDRKVNYSDISSSLTNVEWLSGTNNNGNVVCEYDVSTIDTEEKINTFVDLWKPTDPNSPDYEKQLAEFNKVYDRLMTDYCSKVGTGYCNISNESGNKNPKCSRVFDSRYKSCADWFSQLKDGRNAFINKICKNENMDECKCVNREQDPVYQSVVSKELKDPVLDYCWWKPCQNSSKYLLPTEFTSPENIQCPTNICSVNFYIEDTGRDVNIDNIKSDISCGSDNPDGTPEIKPKNPNKPDNPDDPSKPDNPDDPNKPNNNAKIIVALTIGCVLLILFFVMSYKLVKNSN